MHLEVCCVQTRKGPEGRMCTDPWAVVMAYVLLEGWEETFGRQGQGALGERLVDPLRVGMAAR